MFARIRKATEDREQGFTLIELLVVMIIIGILAAIAIPTFLNQRKNGYRTQMKEDLKNSATALESAAVDKGGNYTLPNTSGVAQLAAGAILWNGTTNPSSANVEFSGTTGDTVTVTKVAAATYCIQATNTNLSGETWFYDKLTGSPTSGTCP